jgi:hypothetical protein
MAARRPWRDTSEALTDIVGGGPFGLEVGEWTDDTAMALADCLESRDALDEQERRLGNKEPPAPRLQTTKELPTRRSQK